MKLYPLLPKQIKGKTRPRLVKCVHAMLSAEFIISKFDIKPLLIIRHPAGIVSSHLYLDNPDVDRRIYENRELMHFIFGAQYPDAEKLETVEARGGLQVGIFYKFIHRLKQEMPELVLINYEDFLEDPVEKSKILFKQVGLEWNEAAAQFIAQSNKEGKGYDTNRRLTDQAVIWKKRLSKQQIDDIRKGYALTKPEYYLDF
jgi:hypothetical protein